MPGRVKEHIQIGQGVTFMWRLLRACKHRKTNEGDSLQQIPKPRRRIKDRELLKQMREEIRYCERCGRIGHGGCHHIKYKSQGGHDIRENLIHLCYKCHRAIHNARYDRLELIEIVASRERKTIRQVAKAIGVIL